MNISVSVIIPTYNYGKYISDAIDSILHQTSDSYEILVVDDGSTDNTADVVRSFEDQKIRYIYQDNQGANVARNRGVKESKGNYLIFLDADDFLDHKHIEAYLKTAAEYPGANIYGPWIKGYLDNSDNKIILDRGKSPNDDIIEAWLGSWWIASCCILWPKQNILKIDAWDENLLAYQDMDIALRALMDDVPFIFCEKAPKAFVREHKETVSTSRNRNILRYESKYSTLKKIENNLIKKNMFHKKYQKKLAVKYYFLARQTLTIFPDFSNKCFKSYKQLIGFSKPPGSYMNWFFLLILGLRRKEQLSELIGSKIPFRF